MPRRNYTLTALAEADLRAAKVWSLGRWGKDLTQAYFADLHAGAQYIAENFRGVSAREALTGDTSLSIYPVREQYLVYWPVGQQHIVIVAVIRQGRDVPAILGRGAYQINRELKEIRQKVESKEVRIK